LKYVPTSSSNAKKNKIQKKPNKKKPTSFHNVPKFLPLSTMAIQIPRPPKDHHQQKMVNTHPPTHFFSSPFTPF
jgi:hypothetical protein